MNTIDIAKLCHNVNRAYMQAMGDYSEEHWFNAPDWKKENAINGVQYHLILEREPSDLHETWLILKESEGWKFGETKDSELKLHPNMLPFDQLPKYQQAKDFIFKAICDEFRKTTE